MVAGGSARAENGCGVEGIGGFLAVVGVAGRALDVVDWTAGRSGRRRCGETGDF